MTIPMWFGVRIDFGLVLLESPEKARHVAELLARPSFAPLCRLSARRGDRWQGATAPTVEAIHAYLLDRDSEAVSLDSGRAGEVSASGQIQTGTYPSPREPHETRFYAYLAFPIPAVIDECTEALSELAATLVASAGFVAVEPSYSRAQEVALGYRLPRERSGLSAQRRRERRGRDWHSDRLATELSGVEWGTFLGPGHLAGARIDVAGIRASGAFERVVELVPGKLAYLQLTADPADDLDDAIEVRLTAARRVLAPVLMSTADVTLD